MGAAHREKIHEAGVKGPHPIKPQGKVTLERGVFLGTSSVWCWDRNGERLQHHDSKIHPCGTEQGQLKPRGLQAGDLWSLCLEMG